MTASSELAFRAQLVIPEQRQLYDYWAERAKGRGLPSREDIHPAHFPALLPFISLVDVDPGREQYRIRLAGTRLREIYDREITGRSFDEIDWGSNRDYWLSAYRRVVSTRRPAQGIIRGPRRNKDHLVQFWLRLPLSQDASAVTMILCYDAFVPLTKVSALGTDLDDLALDRSHFAGRAGG